MSEPRHPSFLALDRMALGLSDDEALVRHVHECAQCEAHVEDLRAGPVHPRRERLQTPRPIAPGAKLRRWSLGAGAVLAAAAALVLSFAPRSEPSDEGRAGFTTRRGAPAVALYVKRDRQVSLWDATQAVRPHDRLRLEVMPDGFTHVGVFVQERSGSTTLLYQGPVAPRGPSMLPRAWEVDDAPEPEVLGVVLAHRPVDAALLASHSEEDSEVWVRTLTLAKERPVTPAPAAKEPVR